jgi:hypothetical protein
VAADEADYMSTKKGDPNFHYGCAQAVVALVVLSLAFLVTVCCLILQQRLSLRKVDNAIIGGDGTSMDFLRGMSEQEADVDGTFMTDDPSSWCSLSDVKSVFKGSCVDLAAPAKSGDPVATNGRL